MKWLKAFVYLVIMILFLQVLKTVVDRQAGTNAFYINTILICIQFLLVLSFFLLFAFCKILALFRLRTKWINIIASAALLIVFVSLEMRFAYLLNHPQKISSRWLWSFRYYFDRYDSGLIQFQENASAYDPGLFYTLKPDAEFNYSKREFSNVFKTNSKGVRDDENSLVSPQVICLGDSYAMGWGVEQPETYAKFLQKQTGLKVLNAAVSSYGTAREMLMLQRLDTSGLKYLVIQYCSNDRGENNSYINDGYKLAVSPKKRYDSLVAGGRHTGKYFPGKYFLLIGQAFLKSEINKLVPVFNMEAAREEPILNEKEHAKAFVQVLNHSPVNFEKVKVIVMFLDRYVVLQNNFLREVETLASQSPYRERFAGNLQLLDLSKILSEQDYYRLDLHIKASGHQKIAQQIADLIIISTR
jgi:hypothetical protein